MRNASRQGLTGCWKPHHIPAEGISLFQDSRFLPFMLVFALLVAACLWAMRDLAIERVKLAARSKQSSGGSGDGTGIRITSASESSPSSHYQGCPRVFVSHSHADDAFTYRLVGDLRTAGAEVWVDDATIRDGNFAKHISDGLDKSDYLVLVLSPNAISSDWVQEEVFTAITLVKQRRMRAVIPVLAAACDPKAMPSVWGSCTAMMRRRTIRRRWLACCARSVCPTPRDESAMRRIAGY